MIQFLFNHFRCKLTGRLGSKADPHLRQHFSKKAWKMSALQKEWHLKGLGQLISRDKATTYLKRLSFWSEFWGCLLVHHCQRKYFPIFSHLHIQKRLQTWSNGSQTFLTHYWGVIVTWYFYGVLILKVNKLQMSLGWGSFTLISKEGFVGYSVFQLAALTYTSQKSFLAYNI